VDDGKSPRDLASDRREIGCVIHSQAGHRHPGLFTALDVSLVVMVTMLALWVLFILAMLIHGATKAGA